MNQTEIDWKNGDVVYWDLDGFDPNLHVHQQLDALKEDLAQVSFEDDLLLDIGWFPSFDKDGEFKVVVIKKENWDDPLFTKTTNQSSRFLELVKEGVRLIGNLRGEAGDTGCAVAQD